MTLGEKSRYSPRITAARKLQVSNLLKGVSERPPYMPSKRHHAFRERLLRKETFGEKTAYDILTKAGLYVEKQKMVRTRKDDGSRKVYFLDLFIPDYALGIEIDGGVHNNRGTYDTNRDLSIMKYGAKVMILRFTNEDVLYRAAYFKTAIRDALVQRIYSMNGTDWGNHHLDMADRRIELKSWHGAFRDSLMRKLENPNDSYLHTEIKWGHNMADPVFVYVYDDHTDIWKGYKLEDDDSVIHESEA